MAEWIIAEHPDGWLHHKCSKCNTLALFDYIMEEDWDEGIDGEWFSLGMRESGINEHITKYCPECGARLNCSQALRNIYGCSRCKHYRDGTSYYTEYCQDCGDYPWSDDNMDSKWEDLDA